MPNPKFSSLLRPNFKILEIVVLNFYFFILCYGMPMYSGPVDEDEDDDDGRTTGIDWASVAGIVVAAATIVCLVMTVTMCICCRVRRKETVARSPMQNGIQSSVFQEVSNTSTEFTIFPPAGGHVLVDQKSSDNVTFDPLPDIHPRRQNQPATNQKPRPATFSNIVGKGRTLEDWFEDPYSNFPRKQLQYVRELGSGWFGQVVEGEACSIVAGQKKSKVVVKILMEGANTTDQMCFLHEVKPFRHLNHPNVLKLLGKCLEGDPFLVILEYCAFKDLKSYLIRHRTEAESLLQQDLLLRMSCNVAAGLQHLHEKGFILTDLAARNCLVASDLNVKVGDYGNSIELYKEDYFCAGGVAVPVRWCAPETLRCTDTIMETREVTLEANIWSFGVVIWEIMEFGKLPYIELSDDELIQRVVIDRTEKLKQPLTPCRHVSRLYQIIQLCQVQPNHRPTMDKLHAMLTYLYANRNLNGDTSSEFEARWHQMQPAPRRQSSSPPRKLSATQSLMGLDFGPPIALPMSALGDYAASNGAINDSGSGRELSPSPHPSLSCDSDFSRPAVSPSMQNLRGSLEDLSSELELGWNSTSASFSRGDSVASISGGDSLRIGGTTLVKGNTDDYRKRFREGGGGIYARDCLSSSSLEASIRVTRSVGEPSGSEKDVSPFTREVEEVIRRLDEDLDRECPSLADATSEIVADEHALSDDDADQASALSEEQPPDSLNLIIDSFPSQLEPSHRDRSASSSSCGSDEDSSWKRIVETSCQESGEVTRIIREKSQSVQDFLKLTVIDSESGSDSDGMPSLKTIDGPKATGSGGGKQKTSEGTLSTKGTLQVRSASLGDVPRAVCREGASSLVGSVAAVAAQTSIVPLYAAVQFRAHAEPSPHGATSLPHTLSHDRDQPPTQLPLTTIGAGTNNRTAHLSGGSDVITAVVDNALPLSFASRMVKDTMELAFGELVSVVGAAAAEVDGCHGAEGGPGPHLYQMDDADSDSDDASDMFSLERRRHRLLHGERLGSFALPSTFAQSRHRNYGLGSPQTGSGGARPRPVHFLPEIVVEECSPAIEEEEDEENSPPPVCQFPVEMNFRFTFKNLEDRAEESTVAPPPALVPGQADVDLADQSAIDVTDPTDVYVAVDDESLYQIDEKLSAQATYREPLTSTPHRSTASSSTPSQLMESDSDVFNADLSFMSDIVSFAGQKTFDFVQPPVDDQFGPNHNQSDDCPPGETNCHSSKAADPSDYCPSLEVTSDDDKCATVPPSMPTIDTSISADIATDQRGLSLDDASFDSVRRAEDSFVEPTDMNCAGTSVDRVARDEELLETGYHSSPPTASDSGTTETLMTHPTTSPSDFPEDAVATSSIHSIDRRSWSTVDEHGTLAMAADLKTLSMVDDLKTLSLVDVKSTLSMVHTNDTLPMVDEQGTTPRADDQRTLSMVDDLKSSNISINSLFSGSDVTKKLEDGAGVEEAGSHSMDEGFEASGEDCDAEESSPINGCDSPVLPVAITTGVLVPLVPLVTISDEMGGDAVTYDNSSVTSSNDDDCILMVDLETNEAVLVDSHRPKSRLSFASPDEAHQSDSDNDECVDVVEFADPDSRSVNRPTGMTNAECHDVQSPDHQGRLPPSDDWNDIALENRQPESSSPGSAAGEAGSGDDGNSTDDREHRRIRDADAASSSTESPLSILSSSAAASDATDRSEESPVSSPASVASSSLRSSSTTSMSEESSMASDEHSEVGNEDGISRTASSVSPTSIENGSDEKKFDTVPAVPQQAQVTMDTKSPDVDGGVSTGDDDDKMIHDTLAMNKVTDVASVADSEVSCETQGSVDVEPIDVIRTDKQIVDRPQLLSVDTAPLADVAAAVTDTETVNHQGASQTKPAPLSPDWDVVSASSSTSTSSCQSPSSSSSMSGEFDCSKEFQYENHQEQGDDPATVTSEQSEPSCPTGYTIVEEDEGEYGDDEGDDEETSRSFTASVWDKDAIPSRGVLKTPDKRYRFEEKKSVSFTFPKNVIIYEYPKEEYEEEEYEDQQTERQMWSYHVYDPQLDYSSYEDWELGNEEIPEDIVEVDDGGSSESSAEFVAAPIKSKSSAGASLYRLSDIPDEEVYGSEDGGDDNDLNGGGDDDSYLSHHPDSFDFATYLAHFNNGNPFYEAAASGGVGPLDQPAMLADGEDFWLKTILNSSDFLVSGSDCPFEFNVGSLESGEELPRWAVSPAAYNAYVDLQGAIESHGKDGDDEDGYEMDDLEGRMGREGVFEVEEEEDDEEDEDVVLDYLHEDQNIANGLMSPADHERHLYQRRTPDAWDDSDGESTPESEQPPPDIMETDSADEMASCNGTSNTHHDEPGQAIVNGMSNGETTSPATANSRTAVKNGVVGGGSGGIDVVDLTNMSNCDRYDSRASSTSTSTERSKDALSQVIAVENT